MKVNDKLQINPLYWGTLKQSEFVEYFKGKASKEKLIEIYKECKKQIKK